MLRVWDPTSPSEALPGPMSSYSYKLPPWLNNAYTESHIGFALRVLVDRESEREILRSMSTSQGRARPLSPSSISSNAHTSSLSPSGVPSQSTVNHYSVAVAHHIENSRYNRYSDIVPYDRTRVAVKGGEAAGRYLNANWILERYGHKWWIATQAPLPSTSHTFLSLLSQPLPTMPKISPASSPVQEKITTGIHDPATRIRTIVQLTRNVERGRTKAHPYFPSEVGKSLVVPPDPGELVPALKVTLLHVQNHEDAQCIQSTVAITPVDNPSIRAPTEMGGVSSDLPHGVGEDHGQSVVFQHMMYTAWPDHGVPEDEDRTSLLAFLRLVDSVNRDSSLCEPPSMLGNLKCHSDPDPPILVGCSAGVGRTGTFIALSSLLRHTGFLSPAASPTSAPVIQSSPLGSLPETLKGDLVAEEIDSLREQRPRMVERPEQILLVYELLIRAFQAS